jgi:glyoxylase-like metal-dependent hydrolase (beta-lactamase superfamily II)
LVTAVQVVYVAFQERKEGEMGKNVMPRVVAMVILCSTLLAIPTSAQSVAPFNASSLVKLGDNVKYGSYIITQIGEGIYLINDPGITTGILGAWGVSMYLICGKSKVLMIDLGNNYIDGYEKDMVAPRKNAAEELRTVIYGLAGRLPLEIALTHVNPDHDGMTAVFLNRKVTFWAGEGENLNTLETQHKIDPSVFTLFKHGTKKFDLGGGRVVDTFLVRGHSNGGTVYILKPDLMLFTGDAFGSGGGQGFSGQRLRSLAEDSQKLVEYISATFSPYQRYALKVYVGHVWNLVYGGVASPNVDKFDAGYLNWGFIQNMNSCANGILKGRWLIEDSGLHYMSHTPDPKSNIPYANVKGWMVYGIGAIAITLEDAYDAAGLKMPK